MSVLTCNGNNMNNFYYRNVNEAKNRHKDNKKKEKTYSFYSMIIKKLKYLC